MAIKIKSLLLTVILLSCLSFYGCKNNQKTVVVYTSVDQVYSEKVFKLFEKENGIKVKAVYDIEASKTVGLANRLVLERDNPQADVFWSGEILQTLDLKEKDVLDKSDISAAKNLPTSFVDSDGYWYGFGGRARVLIVNKSLIPLDKCPKTLNELAKSKYIKQAGIAYPVFGTTATQVAALYTFWGNQNAKEYFSSLKSAGISVLEGNSVVKDFVSQKKLYMGLTDTDDAFSEMQRNKDLDILLLDQGKDDMGTLVIPNTVALIKGAPNPNQADAFIEFLLSAKVEQYLVDEGWIHIPVHSGVTASKEFKADSIKIMQVDFNEVYKNLEKSKNDMTQIFIR
jgi:iron(III) transport system substrate-binding protein